MSVSSVCQQGELAMDFATSGAHIAVESEDGAEQRAAPRFTLLIRAAKLVCNLGEFVCVIRDVSETGVSVRLFHALPGVNDFELHMPGGGVYAIEPVWHRPREAGFRFAEPVDVTDLINEAGAYPKRGLRLNVEFPIIITTLTQRATARVNNVSQQGALIECDALYAIDQNLRLSSLEIARGQREIRAKVRWRRGTSYGVVFDDTFSLSDFATLAAHLQAPALLKETAA